MTSLSRLRSAMLLSLVAAAWLAPNVPARAAEPVAARPALLPRPVALGASAAKAAAAAAPTAPAGASAAKDGSSAAGKPRSRTRALGGDDDLKDLEVERARGKNR